MSHSIKSQSSVSTHSSDAVRHALDQHRSITASIDQELQHPNQQQLQKQQPLRSFPVRQLHSTVDRPRQYHQLRRHQPQPNYAQRQLEMLEQQSPTSHNPDSDNEDADQYLPSSHYRPQRASYSIFPQRTSSLANSVSSAVSAVSASAVSHTASTISRASSATTAPDLTTIKERKQEPCEQDRDLDERQSTRHRRNHGDVTPKEDFEPELSSIVSPWEQPQSWLDDESRPGSALSSFEFDFDEYDDNHNMNHDNQHNYYHYDLNESLRSCGCSSPSSSATAAGHASTGRVDSCHFDGTNDWFTHIKTDIDISDDAPPDETLNKAAYVSVFDSNGESRTFGALCSSSDPDREGYRQLFIFIRHFFCGACRAYVSHLGEKINLESYFSLAFPTSIIVIGCGSPDLIPAWQAATNCPFPIYADPTRTLFRLLGMNISFNMLGKTRPEYMRDIPPGKWIAEQTAFTIKTKGTRRKFRGGNIFQIGGEFLFQNGRVVWCHRMRNYRGHAEVETIKRVLGMT